MRLQTYAAAVAACFLACQATLSEAHLSERPSPQMQKRRSHMLVSRTLHAPPSKREPPTNDAQQSIAAQAASDPVGAAIAAQNLDGVRGNPNGNSLAMGNTLVPGDSWSNANPQDNQFPWNKNVLYYPNPVATPGDAEANGWLALPQLGGFDLVRATIRDNATVPYYVNSGYDPSAIKKAVLILPGKNRDSWKYTNLIRNALEITLTNFPNLGIVNGSVLIIGPAIFNNLDQQYGATEPQDIIWKGSQWQSGKGSMSPKLAESISFYDVLDYFGDWLFNTTNFPNLNGLTYAGHSMGGQAVERYALLRKQKAYDNNVHYLIGNPGSWAWLDPSRPYQNASCENPDAWAYGIGGNTTRIVKYGRADVVANYTNTVSRFRSRNCHYTFGLLDNGAGDTHCQALLQGGNHLDRGSNFVQMLANQTGGFPMATQTVDFVANVSHQDYSMLSTNTSLVHLFQDGYNSRQPDITVYDPSAKPKKSLPNPTPPPRAFATASHKMISYSLLGGSVGAIILVFTVMPFVFTANSNALEQDRWEADIKKGLLR